MGREGGAFQIDLRYPRKKIYWLKMFFFWIPKNHFPGVDVVIMTRVVNYNFEINLK